MDDPTDDGYDGPATLVLGDTELAVTVTLAGHFEPIDGRYHWYGRIAADTAVTALAGRGVEALLRAGDRTAPGTLGDPDPWGRYRIAGTSTPPFAVPTSLADLEK